MLTLYLIVGMVPTSVYTCFNQVSLCFFLRQKSHSFPIKRIRGLSFLIQI